MVLGFEHMTSWSSVSSHNHYTRATALDNCLVCNYIKAENFQNVISENIFLSLFLSPISHPSVGPIFVKSNWQEKAFRHSTEEDYKIILFAKTKEKKE